MLIHEDHRPMFVVDGEYVIYKGFKVYNAKAEYMNVYDFIKEDNYNPQYINVTLTLKLLLKTNSPITAFNKLSLALKKYKRESMLTEALIPILKHHDERNTNKRKHAITKHRSRHRRFIACKPNGNNKAWHYLLCEQLAERSDDSTNAGAS